MIIIFKEISSSISQICTSQIFLVIPGSPQFPDDSIISLVSVHIDSNHADTSYLSLFIYIPMYLVRETSTPSTPFISLCCDCEFTSFILSFILQLVLYLHLAFFTSLCPCLHYQLCFEHTALHSSYFLLH